MKTILEINREILDLTAKLKKLKEQKAELSNEKAYLVFATNNLVREYVVVRIVGNKYTLKTNGRVTTYEDNLQHPFIFATKEIAEEALLARKKEEVSYYKRRVAEAVKDLETEIRFEKYEEEVCQQEA